MPVIPGIFAPLDPITQSGCGPLAAKIFGSNGAVVATVSVPEIGVGSGVYYAAESVIAATNLQPGTYVVVCYSTTNTTNVPVGTELTGPVVFVWNGNHEIDSSGVQVILTSSGVYVAGQLYELPK